MARKAEYNDANVVQTDLKGLYLQKDEVARVFLIEKEAQYEWVHRCVTEGKFRNYVCLGKDEVLIKEGEDGDNCPFCKVAAYDSPVSLPSRKFVTTIVRYRTDSTGVAVKPLMWEVMPWKFPEKVFNNLVAKKAEWGDLREHDIKLKCEVQQYQNFNIEICPTASWKESDSVAAAIVEDYKKNVEPEVTKMLGRKIEQAKAKELVDKILAEPVKQDLTAPAADAPKTGTGVAPATGTLPATSTPAAAPKEALDFKKFLDV